MSYHAFEFLKKIYYVRTAGSKEDLKAAKEIQEEVKRLGGKATLEEFDIDHSNITLSKLYVDGIEIECAGAGYSGVTSQDGVTGDFYYATQSEAIDLVNLKDKIILNNTKRVPHNLYEKAVNDGLKYWEIVEEENLVGGAIPDKNNLLSPEDILQDFGFSALEKKIEEETITVDEEYQSIYCAVARIPTSLTAICKATKKNIEEVNVALTMLELQGVIKPVGGNQFIKV